VNTFRRNLQLAALDNLDRLLRLVAGLSLDVLDLVDNVVALEDLAEDDVTAIEPPLYGLATNILPVKPEHIRSDDGGNEELRAVRVRSGVGHGELALLGVLELEVLILELVTVDCTDNHVSQLSLLLY